MTPNIRRLAEKKIIGMHVTTCITNNKTVDLWRSFMPRRKEIMSNLSNELVSMQIYNDAFDFIHFNVNAEFEKWAAVEVADFNFVPEGMETFVLSEGLYAVFDYKGNPNNASSFFEYVFSTWIPASKYVLDNRPHFEILGDKYKNNDPNSEEEVWIPIRERNNN